MRSKAQIMKSFDQLDRDKPLFRPLTMRDQTNSASHHRSTEDLGSGRWPSRTHNALFHWWWIAIELSTVFGMFTSYNWNSAWWTSKAQMMKWLWFPKSVARNCLSFAIRDQVHSVSGHRPTTNEESGRMVQSYAPCFLLFTMNCLWELVRCRPVEWPPNVFPMFTSYDWNSVWFNSKGANDQETLIHQVRDTRLLRPFAPRDSVNPVSVH